MNAGEKVGQMKEVVDQVNFGAEVRARYKCLPKVVGLVFSCPIVEILLLFYEKCCNRTGP